MYDRRLYPDFTDEQYLDLLHDRLVGLDYYSVWRLRWRHHRLTILRLHFPTWKAWALALLAEARDIAHRATHQPSRRAQITDPVPGARHDR